MASKYAGFLIKAILGVFKFRIGLKHKRGLLIVMLCPFMSARSFRDAAETCGVQEYLLYEAIDELQDIPGLNALRWEGISRLISHLKRLKKADSSVRSRKCITFCGDDFT